MIKLQSYLLGEWKAGSGKASTLVNPANGKAVAETSTEGLDFEGALRFAREVGGPALRAMTFAERGAMLKALSKAIYEAREELIEASMINNGATRGDAKFDIDGASGTLAFYASLGKRLGDKKVLVDGEGEQLMQGARFFGYHVSVPRRGVAVHINAFNFPAWGLGEKLAVSLLAGVPVVSKPATSTALTAFHVAQKLVATGVMPKGAFQFVCGSPGDMLSHLGPQDMIAFTGSSDTAAKLRSTPAVVQLSTRFNGEADSVNAAIVGPDVEKGSPVYDRLVRDVVTEMTQKAGQKCTATRRLFVPRGLMDTVQADLTERIADLSVGDPKVDGVRVGPLATAQQKVDATERLQAFVAAGAKVVFGDAEKVSATGEGVSEGYFFGPTLLRLESPKNAAVVHESEIFGPVCTLMPFDTVEEVIDLVALGGGGLVCSAYTDDREAFADMVLGLAPHHGRVLMISKKVADQASTPGMVLPSCNHGGPGRAGGGEELGGLRGLGFYMQRTAVQGDRALLERVLELKGE